MIPESTDNGKKKKLSNGQQLVVSSVIAAIVIFAIFCSGKRPKTAGNVSPEGYPISRDVFLLDTFCEITIYDGGGEEALNETIYKLNYYDDLFNKSKENSDIYKINHRGREDDGESAKDSGENTAEAVNEADTEDDDKIAEHVVSVAPETAAMLFEARNICMESGGALEPAIKPVTDLWDFKEEKKVPDEKELEEALSKVKSLAWDVDTVADVFTAYDTDVEIDIGAFAKGFIADRIKDCLLENGVRSAIINLGGNILCIGKRPDGEPFKIAIKDPDKSEAGYSQIVECDDASVVTAGIYERCFEEDGILYHHIIDPETGYPVQNNLESVTVTGKESVICDALCTTIFVMGEEKGKSFLESYNKAHDTDYEVIFLRKENT